MDSNFSSPKTWLSFCPASAEGEFNGKKSRSTDTALQPPKPMGQGLKPPAEHPKIITTYTQEAPT